MHADRNSCKVTVIELRASLSSEMVNYETERWKKVFRKLEKRGGRGARKLLLKKGGMPAYNAFTVTVANLPFDKHI